MRHWAGALANGACGATVGYGSCARGFPPCALSAPAPPLPPLLRSVPERWPHLPSSGVDVRNPSSAVVLCWHSTTRRRAPTFVAQLVSAATLAAAVAALWLERRRAR